MNNCANTPEQSASTPPLSFDLDPLIESVERTHRIVWREKKTGLNPGASAYVTVKWRATPKAFNGEVLAYSAYVEAFVDVLTREVQNCSLKELTTGKEVSHTVHGSVWEQSPLDILTFRVSTEMRCRGWLPPMSCGQILSVSCNLLRSN